MSRKIISIVTLVFIFVFFACSKNTSTTVTPTCNPNTSFKADMLPLLNSSCNLSGCHDGPTAAALNNFQVVHDNASQIKASILSGRMPKGSTLSTTQKNIIYCWIDNGAKDN